MKVDISVIIVNYNTEKLILRCIESLYKHSLGFSSEIIVIDNCSSDNSVNSIRRLFPRVKLITSHINLGFAKANNLGVDHSEGEFLFFLNPDTELIENSISVFLDYIKDNKQKNIGVLGCKMIDGDMNPHVSYGNFPTLLQEIFQYGLHKIFPKYYKEKLSSAVIDFSKKVKEVDYIIGANLFIPRQVFISCGRFDNDFFLYYEETELCFRLKKNNYSIIFLPLTQIIHHYGSASKKQDKFNMWLFEQTVKSKFLYFKKCHGLLADFILYIVLVPKILIMSFKLKEYSLLKIFTRSAKSIFK